ncbi:MAG TPA: PQQ-dependent sugar dehydrogenase [Woeseiaceae bacterium]|nr:PQQ-dependent sugar dehydrogenase [Woeseiaceae bacterium]
MLRVSGWSILAAVVLSGAAAEARAERFGTERHDIEVAVVADGLSHPWGLAFLPDGGLLVTERGGTLRIVRGGELLPDPVAGLPPIQQHGQGGLLDVALHPDYADNRLIYLSYAGRGDGGYSTEVLRGRFDGQSVSDVEVIFSAVPKTNGKRHFGSRLLFGPDGKLYVSHGDRGDRPSAQDLSSHNGALLRLNPDGSVPEDNPFVDRDEAQPEIWTYGNRNIQGMALRANGQIWTHEHGPQGGDEVNLMRAGVNYGWPVITYGRNYGIGTKIGEGTEKEGMAQPVHQWTPSIAPSGMTFYDGEAFPHWQGDLFAGSLKFGLLVRLTLDGDEVVAEERMLDNAFGRIRAVAEGPDGMLWLLTDERNGKLLKITPTD